MACSEPMIPRPMKPTLSAISAASRCLDPQSLAGAQRPARLGRQFFPVKQVAPARARLPAGGAGWTMPPALGEQREVHLGQRLELADDTIAAAVRAGTARPAA